MTTQKDIQELINRTQEKIRLGDIAGADKDWPNIEAAIYQYDNFRLAIYKKQLAEQVREQLYLKCETIDIAEIEQSIKRENPDIGWRL